MFTPFYKHPLYDSKESTKFRERWTEKDSGRENACYDKVIGLIKEGAGKHFLNHDFYNGSLPTIEDDLDLRGIKLWKLEIDFEKGDNFKGIDFGYGEFWHIHFKNAVFYSSSFSFAKMYNCTFENCAFAFAGFLGAKLEKCKFINCEFPEYSSFENVMFVDCSFDGCFLGKTTPFRDCFFSDLTKITNSKDHSFHYGEKYAMPKNAKAGLYASIQSAYEASGADELAMEHYWKARKSFTRHNQAWLKKTVGHFNELITGYGIKPLRPLFAMVVVNTLGTFGFSFLMPVKDSILFTAGAFFTFGAFSHHLDSMNLCLRVIYVGFSFMGIILSGLFLATLVNMMFRSSIPNQTVDTER